jgi:Uma2 family endonuclease
MALTIEEAFLPVTLTAAPMSDEEFARFCADHPDYSIEMTAEGEIIIMPPNYSLTGVRNQEIGFQLRMWAKRDGRGVVSDASSGFVLPSGARRSPDAAWIAKSRLQGLDKTSLEGFWHFCPDFVIELRSHFDRLRVLRDKMQEWIANGTQLAWLIDAERRAVEIYAPGREPEVRVDVMSVAGEGPIEGFILELGPVWDPLGS